LSSTAKTRNSEQFEETSEEVASLRKAALFQKDILIDELGMDEVQVSRSLERTISKPEK
jgi:hypothetical protein